MPLAPITSKAPRQLLVVWPTGVVQTLVSCIYSLEVSVADDVLGHWIQISGASVLSISDIVNGTFGKANDKVFSDVDGADEVRDIIQKNSAKRVVDNLLINTTGPKTALVFPPIIYGQGRGAVKQRSVQIPELSRVAIQTRKTIQVEKGEAAWSNVHISDVSDIFVKLVEKALQGEEGSFWNRDGLYFPGNGMIVSWDDCHTTQTVANENRTSSRFHNLLPTQPTDMDLLTALQSRKSAMMKRINYLLMLESCGVPTPDRTPSELDNSLDGRPRVGRWRRRSHIRCWQRQLGWD